MLKNNRKSFYFVNIVLEWDLSISLLLGTCEAFPLSPVTSSSFSPTLLQGFMALSALFKTPPLAQVTL